MNEDCWSSLKIKISFVEKYWYIRGYFVGKKNILHKRQIKVEMRVRALNIFGWSRPAFWVKCYCCVPGLISKSRESFSRDEHFLDRFLKERCYQKLAGHVWFGYLPRYGALCRHARPPFTFHALTTSPFSPSPPSHPPPFTLSSYNLTNISKFMRFYLISLACTSKPTPSPTTPSLLQPSHSQLLLTSTVDQVALYVLATETLSLSLLFFSSTLSFSLSLSLFFLSLSFSLCFFLSLTLSVFLF